jgi:hypothetical protein
MMALFTSSFLLRRASAAAARPLVAKGWAN